MSISGGASTHSTRSGTDSARIRCPRWTGSKVPPEMPLRRSGAAAMLTPPRVEVDADLTQEGRRLLRRHRVDVEARPPLEARHPRQTRNDLHVPVIMRQ